MYGLLADLILITHLLFILFVLFGGLFLLRWPKFIWLHLPALIWGILIELSGWICPLTPIENYFRYRSGEGFYSTSFVERYLLPVIYPEGLTREIQFLLAAIVFIVNLSVYLFVFGVRNKIKS